MIEKGYGGFPGGKAGGGGRNSKKTGMSLSPSGPGPRGHKCTATFLPGNGNNLTGDGGASGGKAWPESYSVGPSACVGGPKGLKRKVTVTTEDYGSPSSKVVQVPSVIRREAVQSRAHEKVSKASFENKNGCYSRLTTKEKVSSHDIVDFYSGRMGIKEEVQITSTFKFGDKSKGYSGEFVTEQKFQKLKH
ncbi:hypothetical protein HHK36_024580 [Tetracentron sinense]|uniref:Uncharacterized protein n=1 Tax=Tetracentron sinense TaxID=13715 RepID=A0A834YJ73_TETSI|nr:hypothetical protein HHK36_024580 [Tetracentron sinense]